MPNRLAQETSPYLLQHADNPVDWWPWCDEAMALAREQDKPILLSVGYSACHWCHVMAHESFEDAATAALMNERFINIKVDREEHPDVDQVYQTASQLLTQSGGWPLTVFMTPKLQPFFAGTYFPNRPMYGRPSFTQVLEQISALYGARRDEVEKSASSLTQAIAAVNAIPVDMEEEPTRARLQEAARAVRDAVDPVHGGFGDAPKFPNPMNVSMLLRHGRLEQDHRATELAVMTLEKMAAGGIYDHLGGGFHRYSTDERWLAPHFEKMLYDNAQLLSLYAEGWLATGSGRMRQVLEETAAYLLREMRSPGGGFYSTQDADSEGVEGKFFVWDRDEVGRVLAPLGADGVRAFLRHYDLSEAGNWEGRNILHVRTSSEQTARALELDPEAVTGLLAQGRALLWSHREQRVKPFRDEKILTSWNGMAIAGLADAGRVLGHWEWTEAAVAAAEFVLGTLSDGDGELLRTCKDGEARLEGTLSDYADVCWGLLALRSATLDDRWSQEARRLAVSMVARFWEEERTAWRVSRAELIATPYSVQDQAVPSGSSVAAAVLWRLAELDGEERHRAVAEATVRSLGGVAFRSPLGMGNLSRLMQEMVYGTTELHLIGEGAPALAEAARTVWVPHLAVHWSPDGTEERPIDDDGAAAYVCHGRVCSLRIAEPDALRSALEKSAVAPSQ